MATEVPNYLPSLPTYLSTADQDKGFKFYYSRISGFKESKQRWVITLMKLVII